MPEFASRQTANPPWAVSRHSLGEVPSERAHQAPSQPLLVPQQEAVRPGSPETTHRRTMAHNSIRPWTPDKKNTNGFFGEDLDDRNQNDNKNPTPTTVLSFKKSKNKTKWFHCSSVLVETTPSLHQSFMLTVGVVRRTSLLSTIPPPSFFCFLVVQGSKSTCVFSPLGSSLYRIQSGCFLS